MAGKFVRWIWGSCQNLSDTNQKGSAPIAVISNNNLDTIDHLGKETEEPVILTEEILVQKENDLGQSPQSAPSQVGWYDNLNIQAEISDDSQEDEYEEVPENRFAEIQNEDQEGQIVNKKQEISDRANSKKDFSVNSVDEGVEISTINSNQRTQSSLLETASVNKNSDADGYLMTESVYDSPRFVSEEIIEPENVYDSPRFISEEITENVYDSPRIISEEIKESLNACDFPGIISDDNNERESWYDSPRIVSEEIIKPVCVMSEEAVNVKLPRSHRSSRTSCNSADLLAEFEESTAVIKKELTRIQSYMEETMILDVPIISIHEDGDATDEEIMESAIADITKNIDEITRSSSTKRHGMYIEVPIVPIYTKLVESSNIKDSNDDKKTRPSSLVQGAQNTMEPTSVDCKRHTVHCDDPPATVQPSKIPEIKTSQISDTQTMHESTTTNSSDNVAEKKELISEKREVIKCDSIEEPVVFKSIKDRINRFSLHVPGEVTPFNRYPRNFYSPKLKRRSLPPFHGNIHKNGNNCRDTLDEVAADNLPKIDESNSDQKRCSRNDMEDSNDPNCVVEKIISPTNYQVEMCERPMGTETGPGKAESKNGSTDMKKHICGLNKSAEHAKFLKSPSNKRKNRQSYPPVNSEQSSRMKQDRHSVYIGTFTDETSQKCDNLLNSYRCMQSPQNKKKHRRSFPQRFVAPETDISTNVKQDSNRKSVHVNIPSDTNEEEQTTCNGHWKQRPYSSADYAYTKQQQSVNNKQKIRQSYPQASAAPSTMYPEKESRREMIISRLSALVDASSRSSNADQQDHEGITEIKNDVPCDQKKTPKHRSIRAYKIRLPRKQNKLTTDTSHVNGHSSQETGRRNSNRIKTLVDDFNRAQLSSVNQNENLTTNDNNESTNVEINNVENSHQVRNSRHIEDIQTDCYSETMNWEMKKQISGIEGGIDIGVLSNGHVVITDFKASNVKVYSLDDQYHARMVDIVSSKEVGEKWFPFGVASGPDGDYYLTNKSSFVDIFTSQGEHIAIFPSTSPSNYLPTTEKTISFGGIATDLDGNILVGECTGNYINVHLQDGSHIGSIKVNIKPRFISVCPTNGNIVISAWELNTSVQIIEPQSGQVLHTLNAPPGVPHWCPSGVHCHKDIIFVSNCPRTCDTPDGIYCFSVNGHYIGCVTNDVFFPLGLTMDRNILMVVELKCVKIFQAQ